jgi:cytokinesis protein
MPLAPSTKMKQLQWDKLQKQQVGKTLWKEEEPEKEQEWLHRLQIDGVWREMEDVFRAKLVATLVAREKRAELKSVLDPQTRKRVEIIIQRVKRLSPEETAQQLLRLDPELCSEQFLSELRPVLPSPEQVRSWHIL